MDCLSGGGMVFSAAECRTSCHKQQYRHGRSERTDTRSCYLVQLRWRTDAVSVGLAEQHACLLLLFAADSSACMVDIPRGRLRSWLSLIASPTRLTFCSFNVACRSLLLDDDGGGSGAAMLSAPPPSTPAAVLDISSGRPANDTYAVCPARKAHNSTLHLSAAHQPTTLSTIQRLLQRVAQKQYTWTTTALTSPEL